MDRLWQLWGVLALVTVFTCFELSAFSILYIDPAVVEVLVNRNFKVTCTANANWTSDDLQFKYVFTNGSSLDVEDIYLKQVNNTSLEFHPPGLISDFHGSHLSCYTPNNESAEARVNVWEQHPLPRIVFYEMWNWEELRFKWGFDGADLSRSMPATFEGWYKDSNTKEFTKCESLAANECTVRKTPEQIAPFAGNVHIKVNGTSQLEKISTDGLLFPISTMIRPGIVKSLNVQTVPGNYSICFANFRAPHQRSMTYNISTSCNSGHYQASKNETPVDFAQIRTSISIMLINLPADVNCTLSINAIPYQGGFWGPVRTISFKTLEAVPVAAPVVCRSCFDLQATENENFRNAVIYFKPLSRELARGKVTMYKIQYIDSHMKWTQSLDPSSFMFSIQNLSIRDEYRLTIEARTLLGFNETLPVPVLAIRIDPLFMLRIERFVVISVNESNVMISWNPLSNASGYTLFWCPKKDLTLSCSDVLNWIELPAIYFSYEISLPSGHYLHKYLFGIGYTLNEGSSPIQWTDYVHDMQAVALPPSVELNASSAFALHLCLVKKSPSSPQFSGFIVNYVIYFCPVSSEDDLGCAGVIKEIIVDGWSSEVHLTNLLPHQKYRILAESWTAAGRSLHNSTVVLMTGASSAIAAWLLALIVVASVIGLFVVIIGLFAIVRFSRHSLVRYKQWLTVGVTTPPGPAVDLESGKCRMEKDNSGNGYVDVANKLDAKQGQMNDEQVEINSNEAPFQLEILPIRHQDDLGDIPLFSEERLLPPVGHRSFHGSSPSIMLHINKSFPSPEKQRILPSIRGKPVYIKPLQRSDDIVPEAIPMVSSGGDEGVNENFVDASEAASTVSYAYARQHNGWEERLMDSLAAPVKYSDVPEESGNDCDTGENEGEDEDEEEEEEDEETVNPVDFSESFATQKMTDSFEHLPPLTSNFC